VQELFLLAGLGNPGFRYKNTRHNIGFMVINRLLELEKVRAAKAYQGLTLLAGIEANAKSILLAKPLTYMNRSGSAIAVIARDRQIAPEKMLIIYDDIALPFGLLRLRKKGSSGGHKGMQSIIEHLQTEEIPRMRIGIGQAPDAKGLVDFVLRSFSAAEKKKLSSILDRAAQAAFSCIEQGIEKTMNLFNAPEIT
jgi:peptidyl-tRNA hydrolase, PTH1 family